MRKPSSLWVIILCILICGGLALPFIPYTHAAVDAAIATEEAFLFSYVRPLFIVSFVLNFLFLAIVLYSLYALRRDRAYRSKIKGLLEPRIAAIENVKDSVFICNADGLIKYANKSLLQTYGYDSQDELIGQSWKMLYPQVQRQWLEDDILPSLQETGQWHSYVNTVRKNGEEFSQDVTFSLLEDGGWISISRDHSEIVAYINLANNRLAAMEAAGDGIGIVDKDGLLTYINKAFMNLHGISREDLGDYINSSWENLYTEKGKQNIRDVVYPALEEEGYWKGEAPIVRVNGEVVPAELSLTVLPDGGLIGTARNITDTKEAQREKEDLQRQFYQAQKMEAVGRLAGGIAHDFNNILASIMGYTEFLMEDLDKDSKQHEFSHKIMQGAAQARGLIDQILTFSRKSNSNKETISLADSLIETVTMLRATVPRSMSINMDMLVEDAYIEANQTQISQTLMNLCVNAKDAMDDFGVLTLRLDVASGQDVLRDSMFFAAIKGNEESSKNIHIEELSETETYLCYGGIRPDHNYVVLSIQDTGQGIPKDVMEHVFEPFFTTKAVDKGTGLGLSSVHGIMIGHGGAMSVNSVVDEGTTFMLYFPVSDKMPLEKAEPVDKGEQRMFSILLVEDQQSVQEMMVHMLSRLGHEAHACSSGEEAIDAIRANPDAFDLVVTDYTMPGITGMELARAIEQDFDDEMPVIILSGYKKKMDRSERMAKNVKAVLKKPVDREVLSSQIQKAVGIE